MAVYQTRELERRALQEGLKGILKKASARRLLPAPADQEYDVFLSHSLRTDVLDQIADDFRAEGLSVYIDRNEDPDLDPDDVTTETARRLRNRLDHSRGLVLAYTENAKSSRWVPWELGFADGRNKRVAVLPVQDKDDEIAAARAMLDVCDRQEFLGLYPYLTKTPNNSGKHSLFVNKDNAWTYLNLVGWLNGDDDFHNDADWRRKVLRAA